MRADLVRVTEVVGLPGCLRAFPAAVVQLDGRGTVLDSNGRLEAATGRALVGRPFAELLDVDASRDKWTRLLASAPGTSDATVWELILAGEDDVAEPRAFSVLGEPDAGTFWLVEHPRDARLDHLRAQVTEVNSELAGTQRALLRERGRLAHTLAEIETQNARLVALTDELHARQQELERSNAALDEFAHVVSHDLKAPLRSLANHAAWLVEDAGDALGAGAREHVDAIVRQVGRMRALIGGILAFARAGRAGGEPEEVHTGALVHEILRLLDPPPSVRVEVDDGLPVLHTARAPLQQVLQNLIDNAIKHAGRHDPHVRVHARDAGAHVDLSISDDGPGIAPERQERIWTLFHSGLPASGVEGTGIGLAVVRRVAEGQGGSIRLDSREGEGATFTVSWPRRPRQSTQGG